MSVTGSERAAARLLADHRWAALATLGEDGPAVSMVAYAPATDLASLLLFLSNLSEHTRNLIARPGAALVVSEIDTGSGDPQTLARVSVKGTVGIIERTAPEFDGAWRTYVGRLPDAAPRIALGDFSLFRVDIREARYVGGFARAGTIEVAQLSAAAVGLSDR